MASILSEPTRGKEARVAAVRALLVRIPLKKTITHASHTRKESDNVVVECRLDDGTVGYGEGVPREYVTGETAESAIELLRRVDWDEQIGRPRDFAEAARTVRGFQMPAVEGDDRGCAGNAARCAAEIALLDAFGKRFGVCLTHLPSFFPEFADLYEPKKHCRYSGAITSKRNLFREILSAAKVWIAWFQACKIKVGTEGQDDPKRLAVFRRILGRKVDFRIDANEAWTPENVVEKIRELEPFGVSGVEQPVPHEQIECLAEVRKKVRTPIILDESLCSMRDAQFAAGRGLVDIMNLRLSKCGGLFPSLELAAFARQRGIGYQLGCQVGETGILSAAGRHFALAVRDLRYVEGSYDHFLVRERLTKENLTFEFGGWGDPLPGPGLGVTIEPERLARVTLREVPLHG